MAGACAGGATFGVVAKALHLRRAPAARLQLYLEGARSHLGEKPASTANAVFAGEALRRILGPVVGRTASALVRALGVLPADKVQLTLRQAGLDASPETYRREHVRWLLLTPLSLGMLGLLAGRATLVVLFFVAGVIAGARRAPERLRARVRSRCERLRGDLPIVLSVLALKIENNKSLHVAIEDVVSQGSGPVVEDLNRALHLLNAGYRDSSAFELIAIESAEPAAARFYRFLSAATGGGLDLAAALLDQANELRAQRREEVERTAARRQMALVLPNLLFLAPVLFMFLLAPLPQLLTGH